VQLGWAGVQDLVVFRSFDASVDAAVAFDYSWIGAVSAGAVGAFLDFVNRFA
jgi:hypothetical protein